MECPGDYQCFLGLYLCKGSKIQCEETGPKERKNHEPLFGNQYGRTKLSMGTRAKRGGAKGSEIGGRAGNQEKKLSCLRTIFHTTEKGL